MSFGVNSANIITPPIGLSKRISDANTYVSLLESDVIKEKINEDNSSSSESNSQDDDFEEDENK